TTLADATAELSAPAIVTLAVAGMALSERWRRGPIDGWAVAAALGVYAAFAAPVVLSGHATFAGYIKLDDTATWLAITDHVMQHGRSLHGLAPSTYQETLRSYLATGYPIGGFLPPGAGRAPVGGDRGWPLRPVLAFL